MKLFTEFDGLRIDHPHGIVCPWVYRKDDPDPLHAVQHGARLYSSPNLPDHPQLAAFSIVGAEQLNQSPGYPRYGDDAVTNLTSSQIDRFAVVLDAILACARSAGRNHNDILCEVLSTWPSPLRAVMTRRGLGRFCVTQKTDPDNPGDLYRAESTSPQDWIMIGNHDTKPLLLVIEEKRGSTWMRDRTELLGQRLVPDDDQRLKFIEHYATDERAFCEAMFAELFIGPAQNVSVFFPDLFGIKETYNKPGTVGDHNWTLRVPRDYEEFYTKQLAAGQAFNVNRSLALALEAKREILGEKAVVLAGKLRETIPHFKFLI